MRAAYSSSYENQIIAFKGVLVVSAQDGSKVEPHRGAAGNLRQFAASFVQARMEGFTKDMQICLTPVPSKARSGPTHAYFPALMACCGTLEYLAGLYSGRTKPCGDEELSGYAAKFLPQPAYAPDAIHILHCALRHSIAHRGIATGVWVDRKPGANRRVTWRVGAETKAPSIVLKAEEGSLTRD